MAATKRTAKAPTAKADSCAQPQPANQPSPKQTTLIPDCLKPNTQLSPSACIQQQHKWAVATEAQRKLNGAHVCPEDCPYMKLTEQEIDLRAGRRRVALARPKDSPAGRLMEEAKKAEKAAGESQPQKEAGPKPQTRTRRKTVASSTTLAGRLVMARLLAGLLQTEARIRVGLSPNALSNAETGKNRPRFENLAKLAALYKVDVDWLRTGRGRGPGGQAEPKNPVATFEAKDQVGLQVGGRSPIKQEMQAEKPVNPELGKASGTCRIKLVIETTDPALLAPLLETLAFLNPSPNPAPTPPTAPGPMKGLTSPKAGSPSRRRGGEKGKSRLGPGGGSDSGLRDLFATVGALIWVTRWKNWARPGAGR